MDSNGQAALKQGGKLKSTHTQQKSSKSTGPRLNDIKISETPTSQEWNGLTLFAEDIPVNRFPLPVSAKENLTPAIFGPICSELLATYDQLTSCWRMSQATFLWDSDEFSETWPQSGTMRNGVCFLRPAWEHRTSDDESSFWPTPDSSQRGTRATDLIVNNSTVQRRASGQKRGIDLQTAVKHWPTPRATEWKDARPSHKSRARGKEYEGLSGAVKMWPTPREFMHKDSTVNRGKGNLGEVVGGQLNPTWVEWLMGFPLGWTDLNASEMPSSHKSRKKSEK